MKNDNIHNYGLTGQITGQSNSSTKLGIKNRHFSPEKVYLLIDDTYFQNGDRCKDGTVICTLAEYIENGLGGFTGVYRVSLSLTVLKKYKRAHDFKQLQEKENKNKMTKEDYIKVIRS